MREEGEREAMGEKKECVDARGSDKGRKGKEVRKKVTEEGNTKECQFGEKMR